MTRTLYPLAQTGEGESTRAYFNSRLQSLSRIAGREISVSEARIKYGITYDQGGYPIYKVDDDGNPYQLRRRTYTEAGPGWEVILQKPGGILLEARRYSGRPFEYVPVQHRKALRKVSRKRKKTVYEAHTSHFYDTFKRLRVHPDQEKGAKYISPPLQRIPSFPMPLVQQDYQRGRGTDCVTFVEGELKAAALDLCGMPAIGFAGIGMYRLDDDLREYLDRCRPPVIPILYDADALDIRREKASGRFTTGRLQDFMNSALRFATELFTYFEEIGHEAEIFFVMVNPDQKYKGIDDLLEASDTDKAAVVSELQNGRSGKYLRSLRLSRTTYERRLREFFNLHDPGALWEAHRDEIKNEPFYFEGFTFERRDGGLVMPAWSAPAIRTQTIQVETFLPEKGDPLLDSYLQKEKTLAISSPTGSGKTTYLIKWAQRTGQRLLMCVPTKNQCAQLGAKYEHVSMAIMGRRDRDRAADAAAHQIVFCTYDTVLHVPDLDQRVLVVDETHHLVNSYNYRAEALNRMLWAAEQARQVVYLSGTMPTTLVSAFKLPLVEVKRMLNPEVRLRRVKAEKDTPQALVEALASQLIEGLKSPGCQYALFNNTKLCEALRDYLVESGHVKADEILVLSAKGRETGDRVGFNALAKDEKIPAGVLIVLSTSVVAEGINIDNENVAQVYAVGMNCPETVRQYVARFRKMSTTDLCLITKPTDRPGHRFRSGDGEGWYLDMLREKSEVAARAYNSQLQVGELVTRPLKEENLKPNQTRDAYEVDRLAILQADKQRVLENAPPAYLVGQLLTYPGFELYSETEATEDAEQATELRRTRKARKDELDAYLNRLRAALATAAGLPLAGLAAHYKARSNRHKAKQLRTLAGQLISRETEAAAKEWRAENAPWLEHKEVTELLRRAAFLHFAGVEDPGRWLALTSTQWKAEWQRVKVTYGLEALEQNDRALPLDLRIELRARRLIGDQVQAFLDSGPERVTDEDLLRIVEGVFTVADGRSGVTKAKCLKKNAKRKERKRKNMKDEDSREVCIRELSKSKAVGLVSELFELSTTRTGRGYRIEIGSRFARYEHEPELASFCTSFEEKPLLISNLRV